MFGGPVAQAQLAHDVAGVADGVGVVLGQVLGGAGHAGMHFRAAQLLVGGDFPGGRLQQRRAGQEHLGAVAHQHYIVREPGLVGAAGGGVAVHHGDLRDAGGGQACLVGEGAGALHEHVGGVVEVGAAGFHQAHHGQPVLLGDALQAQGFMQPGGRYRAALDGGVGGGDQAAHAAHIADAGDGAAAGFGAVLVVVHFVAGQVHQAQIG